MKLKGKKKGFSLYQKLLLEWERWRIFCWNFILSRFLNCVWHCMCLKPKTVQSTCIHINTQSFTSFKEIFRWIFSIILIDTFISDDTLNILLSHLNEIKKRTERKEAKKTEHLINVSFVNRYKNISNVYSKMCIQWFYISVFATTQFAVAL